VDSFDPLCVFGCDDCGDFLVAMPEFLSLFVVDDDIYAFTRCPYCDRVTKNDCDLDVATALIDRGVKLFNWNDGESVGDEEES
jgi:hypothetical protein